MSQEMLFDLLNATWQTLYMVSMSGLLAVLLGLPLGIFLLTLRHGGLLANARLHKLLEIMINALRSIPFIILLVAIIPITRFIVGTSIGTTAAIVPLTLSAVPFIARVVESALDEVPKGLVEAGVAMGAKPWQIIGRILMPEALPAIIKGVTLMLIALVGYAAMAGAIGGGGLGDFAIRYGYQRFDTNMMIITVLILIFLVQFIQYAGDVITRRYTHR